MMASFWSYLSLPNVNSLPCFPFAGDVSRQVRDIENCYDFSTFIVLVPQNFFP